MECKNITQQILGHDKRTTHAQERHEKKAQQIKLTWSLRNPLNPDPKMRQDFHDRIKTAIQKILPMSQVTRSGIDKPYWTLHLRAQHRTELNVRNTRYNLVTAIQDCYKKETTDLEQIKHNISMRNSPEVLEDTEPWTEEIWWIDAREADQSDKGEKTPAETAETFSSVPMLVESDSAAYAAAAGSAKDCATSSTAASVAVSVDAAVSQDDSAWVLMKFHNPFPSAKFVN